MILYVKNIEMCGKILEFDCGEKVLKQIKEEARVSCGICSYRFSHSIKNQDGSFHAILADERVEGKDLGIQIKQECLAA